MRHATGSDRLKRWLAHGAGDRLAVEYWRTMSTDNIKLAREAIVYYLPLYEMTRMQAAGSPRRNAAGRNADPSQSPPLDTTWRWVNLFGHRRQLLGAADRRVVTSNADTLYSNAWLNLQRGPLLIQTPDTGRRYYSLGFLDFWTNPFAYAGTRTLGNAARTLFIHGHRWNGKVPEGTTPIIAPSNDIWVVGRIQADRTENIGAVHSLQDAFQIVLADRPGYPYDGTAIDIGLDPKQALGDAATFVRIVNQALRLNPPPAHETALAARFARLGFGPSAGPRVDLEMLGEAIAYVVAGLDQPRPVDLGNGWSLPFELGKGFEGNHVVRARVARNHIGAIGQEEAMYVMAEVDSTGQPLEGQSNYRLRFAAGAMPQAAAFWSITMYRKADRSLVENPIERHNIGSRTKGLKHDADGGLSITISHARPEDANANWLPAPADAFYLALRLYSPAAVHLERKFDYPAVHKLA